MAVPFQSVPAFSHALSHHQELPHTSPVGSTVGSSGLKDTRAFFGGGVSSTSPFAVAYEKKYQY